MSTRSSAGPKFASSLTDRSIALEVFWASRTRASLRRLMLSRANAERILRSFLSNKRVELEQIGLRHFIQWLKAIFVKTSGDLNCMVLPCEVIELRQR